MSADEQARPVSEATTNDVFATPVQTPMNMPSEDALRAEDDIHAPLEPPSAPYLQPGPSLNNTPRESYVDASSQPRDSAAPADLASPSASTPFLNESERQTASSSAVGLSAAAVGAGAGAGVAAGAYEGEKEYATGAGATTAARPRKPIYKRPLCWLITAAAFIIVVLAVILPIYFTIIKPHNGSASGSASGGSGSNPGSPSGATTGGNGSEVVDSATGETFVYTNNFGGFCEFLFQVSSFSYFDCAVAFTFCRCLGSFAVFPVFVWGRGVLLWS